jgi:Domain of unknown function (DUF5655)/Domain of unknown function (DUF4287)
MATDPAAQIRTMIRNLEAASGVPWPAWLQRARAAGTDKHGQIVAHLKTKHGIGHGYANLIAHELKTAAAGGPVADDDLVTTQYAGAKAALRPLYDALLAEVRKFGPDLEVAPKKANVSLRRTKQFALLQPSTATRFDVGINLKGVPPAGRLEASGSFSAMVSHRVKVTQPGDINAELVGWLRRAYDAAG